MVRRLVLTCLFVTMFLSGSAFSALNADETEALEFIRRPILAKNFSAQEVSAFVGVRLPQPLRLEDPARWSEQAQQLRERILERVVFRGAAANWRQAPLRVEWLDTIPTEHGYRLKKLRYEAVPGLWIPAILYEPDHLTGRVPVVLNVNGHDALGKAALYKQARCLNEVRRGMLALNVEWLGMGQLRQPDLAHGRMNQLDLCGTSGLAPFYLAMQRGLDVLLQHPQADPERVAMAGL